MIPVIYIGFEPKEEVAYHTLVSSIISSASGPVKIVPLDRRKLGHCHKRELDPKQSNSFTYVRFLVPYLENYQGWAMFMDCDMIVRDDIYKLFELRSENFDVMCVQHPDYESSLHTKYLGTVQYNYPRKNWSSVMLFNCASCKTLTPFYVDNASPKELHRMQWAHAIGSLPKEWNHLVGEQRENPDAKIVHFTLGTPCWPRFRNCEYGDLWESHKRMANYYEPDDYEMTG
jgi:lipopolysaccharide biosynthesis glycosyltransferase